MTRYYILKSDILKLLFEQLKTHLLNAAAEPEGIDWDYPQYFTQRLHRTFLSYVHNYESLDEDIDDEALLDTLSDFINECLMLNLDLTTLTVLNSAYTVAAEIKETNHVNVIVIKRDHRRQNHQNHVVRPHQWCHYFNR